MQAPTTTTTIESDEKEAEGEKQIKTNKGRSISLNRMSKIIRACKRAEGAKRGEGIMLALEKRERENRN